MTLADRVSERTTLKQRYSGCPEAMEIPYIFAGETEIDVEDALFKLRNTIGIHRLLLEGGSILNGAFQRSGGIDELSLVVAPIVADAGGKPLFMNATLENYRLAGVKNHDGVLWLNYNRR